MTNQPLILVSKTFIGRLPSVASKLFANKEEGFLVTLTEIGTHRWIYSQVWLFFSLFFSFLHKKGKYTTLPLSACDFLFLKSFQIFCWAEMCLFVSVRLVCCYVCIETGWPVGVTKGVAWPAAQWLWTVQRVAPWCFYGQQTMATEESS